MERLKEILKYILGILAAVIGILVVKKLGDSDKVEDATIELDSKEEILIQNEAKVDSKIEKIEADMKKPVEDLEGQEVTDFWKGKV